MPVWSATGMAAAGSTTAADAVAGSRGESERNLKQKQEEDLLLKGFFAEVSEVERDNEVVRWELPSFLFLFLNGCRSFCLISPTQLILPSVFHLLFLRLGAVCFEFFFWFFGFDISLGCVSTEKTLGWTRNFPVSFTASAIGPLGKSQLQMPLKFYGRHFGKSVFFLLKLYSAVRMFLALGS